MKRDKNFTASSDVGVAIFLRSNRVKNAKCAQRRDIDKRKMLFLQHGGSNRIKKQLLERTETLYQVIVLAASMPLRHSGACIFTTHMIEVVEPKV